MSEQEQIPNHITYFKVENFKCFGSFELNNLGLFNIITGDNNIGKTSLLEALTMKQEGLFIAASLYLIYTKRENYSTSSNILHNQIPAKLNYTTLLNYFLKDTEKGIQLEYIDKRSGAGKYNYYSILNKDFKKSNPKNTFAQSLDDSQALFVYHDIQTNKYEFLYRGLFDYYDDIFNTVNSENKFFPVLVSMDSYGADLVGLFSRIENDRNKIQLLNENTDLSIKNVLKDYVSDIEYIQSKLDPSTGINYLAIKTYNDIPRSLSTYGDGMNKFIRILLKIIQSENNYILIDEIDTGIYYKRFKKYWKAIFQFARINNVQIFATTHSKECLEYLEQVVNELGEEYQKELRYINMYRNKEDKIVSTTFSYKEFQQALENENEIR